MVRIISIIARFNLGAIRQESTPHSAPNHIREPLALRFWRKVNDENKKSR